MANRLLRGASDTTFAVQEGADAFLPGVTFVVTLDADNKAGLKNKYEFKQLVTDAGRQRLVQMAQAWAGFAGGLTRLLAPVLNGSDVKQINADLTAGSDTTQARPLTENARVGFVGDVKSGRFDISWDTARKWLATPNPNGRLVETRRPIGA